MKNLKKVTSIISAMAIMFVATTAFAMSTGEFDRGLSKGIDYFNKGLYYEARDEFQWFCDANWGKMNEGQQKYALDYLDGAKQKIKEIEGSAKVLSQSEFDKGMSKGIDYFNKGMYYEARDEFQWFCNAKWGKMNKAQQQYALDYLGGAKEKIKEWENKQKNSEKQRTSGDFDTSFKKIANIAKQNGIWDSKDQCYNYDFILPTGDNFRVSHYPSKGYISLIFSSDDSSFGIIFDRNSAIASEIVYLDNGKVNVMFSAKPYASSWSFYQDSGTIKYSTLNSQLKSTLKEICNNNLEIVDTVLQGEFGVSLSDMGMYIKF